jgi:hypothetical protein
MSVVALLVVWKDSQFMRFRLSKTRGQSENSPPDTTDATLFAPVNAVSKTDVTPPLTSVVKEEYTLPPSTVVPIPVVPVLLKY